MYVIQTSPNRSLYGWRGPSQRIAVKYAKVRADQKFDWVIGIEGATLFNSIADVNAALGRRAQRVNKLTNDIVIAEVERAAPVRLPPPAQVRVVRVLNGHGF